MLCFTMLALLVSHVDVLAMSTHSFHSLAGKLKFMNMCSRCKRVPQEQTRVSSLLETRPMFVLDSFGDLLNIHKYQGLSQYFTSTTMTTFTTATTTITTDITTTPTTTTTLYLNGSQTRSASFITHSLRIHIHIRKCINDHNRAPTYTKQHNYHKPSQKPRGMVSLSWNQFHPSPLKYGLVGFGL